MKQLNQFMFSKGQTNPLKHRFCALSCCFALLVGFMLNPHGTVMAQALTQGPDLIVKAVTFDGRCNATFTIENRRTPTIANNFYFSISPIVVTGSSTPQTVLVGPIPGVAGLASVNWVRPNTVVQNVSAIAVTVDPQNFVVESIEQNNSGVFPVPSRCRLLTPVTPVPTRIPG